LIKIQIVRANKKLEVLEEKWKNLGNQITSITLAKKVRRMLQDDFAFVTNIYEERAKKSFLDKTTSLQVRNLIERINILLKIWVEIEKLYPRVSLKSLRNIIAHRTITEFMHLISFINNLIKNTLICPRCKAEMPKEAKFCGICGTKLK